jgi:uncharacterized protein
MNSIILSGRKCSGGKAQGEALVARHDTLAIGADIGFSSGEVITPGHELHKKMVAGKIVVFHTGRGSTADPYLVYCLKQAGKTPVGIINVQANPTTVAGAILCGIPMVHKLDRNPLDVIETGDTVAIDADNGRVEVIKACKVSAMAGSGGE